MKRGEPLKVHGTLDDILRAAMLNPRPPKRAKKKAAKRAKKAKP